MVQPETDSTPRFETIVAPESACVPGGSNTVKLVYLVSVWGETGITAYRVHASATLEQVRQMGAGGTTVELNEHGTPTALVVGGQVLECYAHES